MNPYALPAIVAFALLLMVSFMVIFQNPRDKTSRILFLLILSNASYIGAAAMLHLSVTEAEARFWNKPPLALSWPGFILMVEFVLHLSGRKARLSENFLGIRVSVHRWFIYTLTLISWAVLLFTDLLVRPPAWFEPTGWEHTYGPLYPYLFLFAFYLVTVVVVVLARGVKTSDSPIQRKFIKFTMIAVIGQMTLSLIIGGVLPQLGIQGHSIAPLANIYMCFLLTIALMRAQRETVKDFQNGLEEKVAQRTEELNTTNRRLEQAQAQISRYIDPNITDRIFAGEFTAELSHQRTKLTLFFSDIKDFTKFADSSDPEDVAHLLNEYLGEMAEIVRAHGGTIPQFTGDGIFALFGAPSSKGEKEDALACVRMAMAMQGRMKVLREKWWNEGIQFPFMIRCGINTGMVNVGNYGSEGFMEYLAIGLATNLAARLETACEPGEIYLSHATWGLVNDEIPCQDVGTIEAKGFHYPVQTYKVVQTEAG